MCLVASMMGLCLVLGHYFRLDSNACLSTFICSLLLYFYVMDTFFAVKRADSLTDVLGCTGKSWILVKPCENNITYPKYHIFCVPNTQTATVQESQGGVKGKKDTGDGTEKAKRIYEMRCFELLAGIQLDNGPGSNGNYTLLCRTCKVDFFKPVKTLPSKTEENADTTTILPFLYYCCSEVQYSHSSQTN